MKDTITQQLDENDMECVNILKKIGYPLCVAKVITALTTGGKSQKEIGVCINENQSAVSIALKKLSKENLINRSEGIKDGEKGRPCNIYKLTSWQTMVDTFERKIIREIEKKTAEIKTLKGTCEW